MNTDTRPRLQLTTNGGGGIDIQRLAWLDILKGIAIYFVVLGHFSYAEQGGGIKTAIYAFHMSLFFYLSRLLRCYFCFTFNFN